jgi:hypothetical protein
MHDIQYGLRCQNCRVDSALYFRDHRPLRDVVTLWPHIKAILDSESVWIEAEFNFPDAITPEEGSTLPEFLEEHDGHQLLSIDERGATAAIGARQEPA